MKGKWLLIVSIIIAVTCSGIILSADTKLMLTVTPNLPSQLFADGRSRIPMNVELLDKEGKLYSQQAVVKVTVERGGFSNPKILTEGIVLTKGHASMEYIAPGKPGSVSLKFTYQDIEVKVTLDFLPRTATEVAWLEKALEISKVRGEVLWQEHNQKGWKPVRNGLKIGAGNSVRSGAKGWAELNLPDQSQILLQPNSELDIKVLRVSSNNPNLKQSIFIISNGKVLNKVTPYNTPGSKFEIGSESVTAGVRGTIFEVGMSSSMDVWVYEGEVDLWDETKDQIIPIKVGEVLSWSLAGGFSFNQIGKTWAERELEIGKEQALSTESVDDTQPDELSPAPTPTPTPSPTPTPTPDPVETNNNISKAQVSGKVLDAIAKIPIPNLELSIILAPFGQVIHTMKVGVDGSIQINGLEDGIYMLEIDDPQAQYQSAKLKVVIVNQECVEGNNFEIWLSK